MKIALIGYGTMGRLIEQVAVERGHQKVVVVNENHAGLDATQLAETLNVADVAIDFSQADAVVRNVEACFMANLPLVEGTTGWNDQRATVERLVNEHSGSLVYGANFSIGVNIFYRVAEYAAELIANFSEYDAFIEEQHHSRKLDAPSGTALEIKQIVERHLDAGDIASTRAGNIPGTHRLGFDGPADQILIEHAARSRQGFALGAVKAAEWIVGKSGLYQFADVMDEILRVRS